MHRHWLGCVGVTAMDIKIVATQVLMQKFGGNTDPSVAKSALDDLVGGDDGFDLGRLVSLFTTAGGEVADSVLFRRRN